MDFPDRHAANSSNWGKWKDLRGHRRVNLADGQTIIEVFFNQCALSKNQIACADERVGVQTYLSLKLRTILLAHYIQKLPGKYIGIMLPASVTANLLVLATQLAGKIPLMINWTVGKRHLESVLQLSNVEVVISSETFLERNQAIDLEIMGERMLVLEKLVQSIFYRDKLKAWWWSKRSTHAILKHFDADSLNKETPAVLVFTSGTENQPKGVPLSHENILSNLRACMAAIPVYSDDVIYSFLPPFHSFGFTVGGMGGLLMGVRIFYFPSPTDSKRLARNFVQWQITLVLAVPTFLKGMIRFLDTEQIKTLRFCIIGSEKAPAELSQMFELLGKKDKLIEGYGITECSPVLTLNPLDGPHKGVGKPLSGVKIRIVNPDTFEQLSANQQGLILANGPNMFKGYLNPSKVAPFKTIDGIQWYITGDLGYLDELDYLTISGRLKRFVKIGGEMVSLGSIEETMIQSLIAKELKVKQDEPSLAVHAREIPGEKTRIYLFTIFDLSVDEVNKVLKEAGFSNLVKIAKVIKLEKLPLTGTGKVNYYLLEDKFINE